MWASVTRQPDSVLNDLAIQPATERARYLRLEGHRGVEVLHATFIRHRYALHTHDTFTIAVVERGAATFELDGERHVAGAGSVFVIPPHRPHTGESATAGGYTYKVLYVDPGRAAAALDAAEVTGGSQARVVVTERQLVARLERLHRSLAPGIPDLEPDELLTAALASLRPLLTDRVVREASRRRLSAVRGTRAVIEERFTERVTLDELARDAGLSPWHLSRSFREAFGMPPSAYQRQLRVELAKRQLADGEPIARIAAECGFADQAHLTREFKRVVGVPPGAYAAG